MGLKDELATDVKRIFATDWQRRQGEVVPEAEAIRLGNDAVEFPEGVVLYADLVASTKLVDGHTDYFAAEIYKTFLHCASKIIKANTGAITAFDGDRIMAVFIGSYKRTNAVKTALKINYAVKSIIQPAIIGQYLSSYTLEHAVGIDASKLFIAKTGVRGSNDLVWVGKAANYAARLCSIRDSGFSTFITPTVYDKLAPEGKRGGRPEQEIWERRTWTEQGGAVIYCSNWTWTV